MDYNFIKKDNNEFELNIVDYETRSIVTIPNIIFDKPTVVNQQFDQRGGVGNASASTLREFQKVELTCTCYPNKNKEIWTQKFYRNHPKNEFKSAECELQTLKSEVKHMSYMLEQGCSIEEISWYVNKVIEDWDEED